VSSFGAGSIAGTFVGQILSVTTFNFCGQICNIFPVSQEACGVAQLFGALRSKPQGRGFDSRWGYLFNAFNCTMGLGSTQLLTEMSTRDISWEQRRSVRRADILAICVC
jgi:hypothetical protein